MEREVNLLPIVEYPRRTVRDRLRFWHGVTQTIGITIEADAVRAVVVDRRSGHPRVVCAEMVPLPENDTRGSDALVHALRVLRSRLRSAGCARDARAVLGISGPRILEKRITMPRMDDAELDESFLWEAEQYIPYPIADVFLDWEHMRKGRSARRHEIPVTLVAAKRELLVEQLRVLRDAGFVVGAVEPAAWSMRRLLRERSPACADERCCIQIGTTMTSLAITDGTDIAFTRDVMIGAGTSPDAFASEIQRSLDFYLATTVDVELASVELLGSGSDTPGVADAITRTSGLPTHPFACDAVAGLETPLANEFLLTLGLALRNDWAALEARTRQNRVWHRTHRDEESKVVAITHARAGRTPQPAEPPPRRYRPSDRALGRCYETLAFLLGQGIHIFPALEVMADDPRVASRRFRRTLLEVREAIEHGATFAEAFGQRIACSPVILRAIEAGDQNRVLPDTLLVCAQFLRNDASRAFLTPESAARIRAAR